MPPSIATRKAAQAFDRRLRADLDDEEIARLADALRRLQGTVGDR